MVWVAMVLDEVVTFRCTESERSSWPSEQEPCCMPLEFSLWLAGGGPLVRGIVTGGSTTARPRAVTEQAVAERPVAERTVMERPAMEGEVSKPSTRTGLSRSSFSLFKNLRTFVRCFLTIDLRPRTGRMGIFQTMTGCLVFESEADQGDSDGTERARGPVWSLQLTF